MSRQKILWVEDDILSIYPIMEEVKDAGIDIVTASNTREALDALDKESGDFSAVILDVRMPPGKQYSMEETRGGFQTGIALGRTIKDKFPKIPIIGISVATDSIVEEWFTRVGVAYLTKPVNSKEILHCIKKATGEEAFKHRFPEIFIVHGHDNDSLYQLKNYIQNILDLGEPIILRDQPSFGRTIIEKFEDETKNVDLVFVLLTPDDEVKSSSGLDEEKWRARQNVIFEIGYFYAKLQRKKGRVLLLYSGELELPSDISGIIYINITQGIEAAGETLRRELREWL